MVNSSMSSNVSKYADSSRRSGHAQFKVHDKYNIHFTYLRPNVINANVIETMRWKEVPRAPLDPLHVAMSARHTLRNSATQVRGSVWYSVDIVTGSSEVSQLS
jgi:hypothetical protein